MDESILGLRQKLSANLGRLIGNPRIEAKELAAFDLMLSRRSFLQAAQAGTVGALVTSQLVPTAWGRVSPGLAVSPRAVGLTRAEQASIPIATQVIGGTELFQDTIYARPLIAQSEPHLHAVIEGVRGRLKVQSTFDASDPIEAQFLDTDYHFGPAELLQLEQDPTSQEWALAHYYYPLLATSDGGKTGGLVRREIVPADGTLSNPTKVYCVTGPNTNRFVSVDGKLTNNATYLVYVECDGGRSENWIMVGTATLTLDGPQTTSSAYPIRWAGHHSGTLTLPYGSGYVSTDLYCASAISEEGDYDAAGAAQYVVLKTNSNITYLTVSDANPQNLTLLVSVYGISQSTVGPAHIEWTDAQTSEGIVQPPAWVVLARSDSNAIYSYTSSTPTLKYNDFPFGNALNVRRVTYAAEGTENEFLTALNGASLTSPDFSKLSSVNDLYSIRPVNPDGSTPGQALQLKLVNFDQSWGLSLLVLWNDPGDSTLPAQSQVLACYPLQMPDDDGVGEILDLSGGMSRFGGMRYFALDANGNGYLLRQPRLKATSSPYTPPIHGRYDTQGNATVYDGTAAAQAVPAGTVSDSNLWHLLDYVTQAAPPSILNNILMDAVLGFQTDPTNASQGVWLGNGYTGIHAATRSNHDSHHFAVRQVQGADDAQYAVFSVFNQIIGKTWRSRQIAMQTAPLPATQKLTGEFYQASLAPANAYGTPVRLDNGANDGVQFEIRADSPCTVIDEVRNLMFDVDRYASFMAVPDQASGRLTLSTQADVLSQVIYARLVSTSALTPSSSDSAMLTATEDDSSDWATMELAAQAQLRLGNDGTQQPSASGPAGTTPDTMVYVDTNALTKSQEDDGWETKGDYSPTAANFGSLATYLNQSGRNLVSISGSLTGTNDDPVDPLLTMTGLSSSAPDDGLLTTTFSYAAGTITALNGGSAPQTPGLLGSIWSSMSHALHDALHWLQNVEASAYQDLENGVQVVIAEADVISVTVSADIMKQVTGVEQDLAQGVSTVEEYASVVVNLVVTVVENSFIYKFIEDLIALISLYKHLEDILALNEDLKTKFSTMFPSSSSQPVLPLNINIKDTLSPYLGPGNSSSDSLSGVDTDDVGTEIANDIVNYLFNNPITNKLLGKVINVVTQAIESSLTDFPLQFSFGSAAAQDIANIFSDLTGDLANVVDGVSTDIVSTFVSQIAADVENPKDTFINLSRSIEPLLGQIDSDFVGALYDALQTLVDGGQEFVKDAVEGGTDFVTLDIGVLADLFSLFGLGTSSGDKLVLSAADAFFFPFAVALWVTGYVTKGKSITSIETLAGSTNLGAGLRGTAGLGSQIDGLDLGQAIADGVIGLLYTGLWSYIQAIETGEDTGNDSPTKWLWALAAWINAADSLADFTILVYQTATGQSAAIWDAAGQVINTVAALADVYYSLPGFDNDPGDGLPSDPTPGDVTNLITVLVAVGELCFDTADALTQTSDLSTSDVLALVGSDLGQVPTFICYFYELAATLAGPSGIEELKTGVLPEAALAAAAIGVVGSDLVLESTLVD